MVYTPSASEANCPSPVVFDAESPCIFTGQAATAISGGQFVYVSGTNGAVIGSMAGQYAASDLQIAPALHYSQVNGIALSNVAANAYVSIARKGAFIVKCADAVSGGCPVLFSSGAVSNIWSTESGTAGAAAFHAIGRALSAGASGGYALIALNC